MTRNHLGRIAKEDCASLGINWNWDSPSRAAAAASPRAEKHSENVNLHFAYDVNRNFWIVNEERSESNRVSRGAKKGLEKAPRKPTSHFQWLMMTEKDHRYHLTKDGDIRITYANRIQYHEDITGLSGFPHGKWSGMSRNSTWAPGGMGPATSERLPTGISCKNRPPNPTARLLPSPRCFKTKNALYAYRLQNSYPTIH